MRLRQPGCGFWDACKSGLPAQPIAYQICGVQRSVRCAGRHQPSGTPHKCRRHITHQMWLATFDARDSPVRFVEAEHQRGGYVSPGRRLNPRQAARPSDRAGSPGLIANADEEYLSCSPDACNLAPGGMSARGLVSRAWSVQTAMRNFTGDEGRSFEFDNQVLISSHRKLLWSKSHGGERCGKVGT